MKNLLVLIGAMGLVAALTTTPVKAGPPEPLAMDVVRKECNLILLPRHCDRIIALGNKSVVAFISAVFILIEDGVEAANEELDKMLEEIERIQGITPEKEGVDI